MMPRTSAHAKARRRTYAAIATLWAALHEDDLTMGCLPVPLFFLLGFGFGYVVGGNRGALWGAGIGLALGLVGMGWFVMLLRRRR